jgi:LEA14-like dessication related protein
MHPDFPSLFKTLGTLAICLPLMTGCSLPAMVLGRFEPPITVVSASKVESISLGPVVLRFVLTVRNPNAFGLRTHAVRYRLSLSNQVIAEGRTASGVTVPPHASSIVEFRMEVPFTALSNAAPGAMMLGEIPYELDGALVVGSFLSQREVPFTAASVLRVNLPLELAALRQFPSPPAAGTGTLIRHS